MLLLERESDLLEKEILDKVTHKGSTDAKSVAALKNCPLPDR